MNQQITIQNFKIRNKTGFQVFYDYIGRFGFPYEFMELKQGKSFWKKDLLGVASLEIKYKNEKDDKYHNKRVFCLLLLRFN